MSASLARLDAFCFWNILHEHILKSLPPEVEATLWVALEHGSDVIPSHINTKPNTISIHAAQCPSFLPLRCRLHGMHTRVSCHKYQMKPLGFITENLSWGSATAPLPIFERVRSVFPIFLLLICCFFFCFLFFSLHEAFLASTACHGWPRLSNLRIFFFFFTFCFSPRCLFLTHWSSFMSALFDVGVNRWMLSPCFASHSGQFRKKEMQSGSYFTAYPRVVL